MATVKVSTLSDEAWTNLSPKGEVTKVTISSPPVIEFKVTDANGNPVVGLGNMRKRSTDVVPGYLNLGFTIAKLVPGTNGSPSRWVSYVVTSTPTTTAAAAPSKPTTDSTGTLVDNGDGSYKYTFYRDITKVKADVAAMTVTAPNDKADLGDLTYEPNLTHRVVVQVYGNKFGTGSNTADGSASGVTAVAMANPLNLFYDFIPATGKTVTAADSQRDIVATANCNECHNQIGVTTPHGGRVDTRFCVTCHNDQRKYGTVEATATATGYSGATVRINGFAVGDFPNLIHKTHMGNNLTKTGYNYPNTTSADRLKFEEFGYSILDGGAKICRKCHDGSATAHNKTTQGDNWMNVPSRLACGACHDGINFATGAGTTVAGATTGHVGGAKADDKLCAVCHDAAAISTYHQTQNVTAHNPTVATGLANFTYEIKTVTASATDIKITFRILKDGTAVSFLPAAAGLTNPLSGFTGAPSFLIAYAKSQDGVAPAEYNNLGNGSATGNGQPQSVSIAALLNTTTNANVGSLAAGTGADAGYYVATITGAAYLYPAGATMRAVALQGYFTQVSPAAPRHAISVIKGVTGDAVRRSVVDPAKCSNCHEWFEGHGGNRVYQTQVCVVCHNPNISSSGRGISDTKLSGYNFTAEASAILASWGITKTKVNGALDFPVTSNNFKDLIHGIHMGKERSTDGAIPFRDARNGSGTSITLIDAAKIGFPGKLYKCETCHIAGTYSSVPATSLVSTHEAKNAATISTVAAAAASLVTVPQATDKVTTPFAAACVACHAGNPAKAHMAANGGQILVDRSAQVTANETCAVCHGVGKDFDPAKVHQ